MLSQLQINITEMTPKNQDIGESKHKRERSLTPNSELHLIKNHNSSAFQTEPRSTKRVKDLTQEVQRLECDILTLQDTLKQKEAQNKQLEQEVENLKLALIGTTDQLLKSDPSEKKVLELQNQLKNKDMVIE